MLGQASLLRHTFLDGTRFGQEHTLQEEKPDGAVFNGKSESEEKFGKHKGRPLWSAEKWNGKT